MRASTTPPGVELLYKTDFLLVANSHIVSVTPRQSVTSGQPPWMEATAGIEAGVTSHPFLRGGCAHGYSHRWRRSVDRGGVFG